MRRVVPLALTLLLLPVSAAAASQQLGDRDVTEVTLSVNGRGEALVGYRTADGRARAVLAAGAIDANPPDSTRAQVRFRLRYAAPPRRFRGSCGRYDGPPLVYLVAACKAPDGTYWALQRWQRLQPLRGFDPFLPEHGRAELHLSHWSGPLPELEVSPNWTYGGAWQGLFGRLTYRGAPVYGFRTPSATRSDPYARFVYIDTLDSAYGPGWRRDTGVVTHAGNGAFCYSFVPQAPPAGYPSSDLRGPGNGSRHRVTAMGPGATPIVQWEGPALGGYDPAGDAVFDALFDLLVGGADRACAHER